jgi:hypothetical protein
MSAMGRLQTFGWNDRNGWKADIPLASRGARTSLNEMDVGRGHRHNPRSALLTSKHANLAREGGWDIASALALHVSRKFDEDEVAQLCERLSQHGSTVSRLAFNTTARPEASCCDLPVSRDATEGLELNTPRPNSKPLYGFVIPQAETGNGREIRLRMQRLRSPHKSSQSEKHETKHSCTIPLRPNGRNGLKADVSLRCPGPSNDVASR